MNRELSKEEIIYNFELNDVDFNFDDRNNLDNGLKSESEYGEIYERIKTALNIDKEGYNVYIIENFSKDRLENIMNFIDRVIGSKKKIQDICYVVMKDGKIPKAMFLPAGRGKKLKYMLNEVQNLYFKCTYEFYNDSSNQQKQILERDLQIKRGNLINKAVEMAQGEGFSLKITEDGFSFIPLKEQGKMMSEEEYDLLSLKDKEEILNKVSRLKSNMEGILEQLKNMELSQIERIKLLLSEYYKEKTGQIKREYLEMFKGNEAAVSFLNRVCGNIEREIQSIYTINYEVDKENIIKSIYKYSINVLVDNGGKDKPPIIFEEDPSISNLLGSIEYENKNGNYITDVSLITPGSLLKANGGCLILRVSDLLNNKGAYYYLKKSVMTGKVDLNYSRGYLELLSLSGLKPEPIKFNEKIILIGDYGTYDLLYRYDEDFKKMFKLKGEHKSLLKINKNTKAAFLRKVFSIYKENSLHPVNESAIRELARVLSKKAEDKNKLLMDDYELEKILMISDNKVSERKKQVIDKEDILNAVYGEKMLEEQLEDMYREGQIFIDVKEKVVGQINGLSVISTGYFSLGKPVRITCSCLKGSGNIVDIQKESDLSGKIHNKSVNILRGCISRFIGEYEKLPVDFHLSFEQTYGKIDGDSASVAETLSIISSLSKIGIKQNIAVTGSINQFGEVQPVGGINEKIEGFFKVCKILDSARDKGVLIPRSNVSGLVLNDEVEQEIIKDNFHIYYMYNLKDAVEILMGRDYSEVINEVRKELKKYSSSKEKHKSS
ncbi:AAA family ATPase [Clostridium luticellarii]|jgi:predicted ATP-dependent protease|uniref:endopeptidase La n=1 Tax=Clostridium luticellarii TaxID=1691940 RepID=A0A2T0BRZ3_9CLOT|nr:AAA family ATPase [Clostridium luticellarii]MCI1943702.1 AAA family ATPase [Clostridium luticellarii]MCI1966963.1 AAA family ATPase [Clostridium luticellarii]MCI1994330.1 AAA family ATPase [Clostridium luticellarii]MCI2038717.1 AAA family ATPase [Clostridium luticellarii]PRR86592.1 Lon protease [Clostridium luticellarii]